MDRQLVEALFARYREPVYRFLRRLLGDAAAAEDLTQDVFLRAIGANYQASDQERAWVFQIARNLARDHARKVVHRGPLLESVEEPEDPRFAEAILQYDLWLTHQGRDGRQQVRHFTGMGMQGAELAFAFVPLRFQVPQRIQNQAMYDVTLSVAGTLRGRPQDDGRIALPIDTARREGLGPRDGSPLSSHAGSGVKRLEVTGSEAVEIELPVPGGRSSLSAIAGVAAPPRRGPQPAPTEAVTVADGRVTVDDALFFEGQRTSLVLQIREVR